MTTERPARLRGAQLLDMMCNKSAGVMRTMKLAAVLALLGGCGGDLPAVPPVVYDSIATLDAKVALLEAKLAAIEDEVEACEAKAGEVEDELDSLKNDLDR